MRVLIIDNNIMRDSWGAPELRRAASVLPGRTLVVRRAPHGDLPAGPRSFDRVIVSGSMTGARDEAPWIARLDEFLRGCIGAGLPVLGVCYGHQSLARVLGGISLLRRTATPELGWTLVRTLEPSRLFEGLPAEFHTFSSHYDEVAALPPGTKLLARSEGCAIQAFELAGKPIFGIQFHPERSPGEAERFFQERRNEGKGALLIRPRDTDRLYDQRVGETIFRNFLKL